MIIIIDIGLLLINEEKGLLWYAQQKAHEPHRSQKQQR